MKAKTQNIGDMLKRAHRFILDNPIEPPMPLLTAAHADLVAASDALEAAASTQVAGSDKNAGGVDVRVTTARDLREYLKALSRTVDTLEEANPGITPTFRLPRTGSYPALIAKAHSVIAAATPLQASFVAAGLPNTFLTEVQTLLTAFEAATSKKQSGGITRTGGTADLDAKASDGVRAAKKVDVYVRNHFRGNAEKIAAWTHARRIERAPRRSTAPAPGPATPVATPTEGNSGSGNTQDGGL